jgi:WD40 repeat protein
VGGATEEDRSLVDLFASALVASYVDDPRFVARNWLVTRVQEALEEKDVRFVLLTGEPGSGKSGLMAHLARLHADWSRYFIRRDSVTALEGGDARRFMFSVGYQLARLRPSLFDPRRLDVVVKLRASRIGPGGRAVGIEMGDLRASPFYQESLRVSAEVDQVEGDLVGISARNVTLEPRLLDLSNLQYLALLDPAQALIDENPQARIVVLVDALDEVRYGARGENVVSWLAACPELPANVRFVVTSRPDPSLASFRQAKAAELVELAIDIEKAEQRDRIREDLRRFIHRVAVEPAIAGALEANQVQSASFVKDAVDKARGNFQYVVALARGIDQAMSKGSPSENLAALLRLEGIPSGISELYRFFLAKIKEEADRAPIQIAGSPLAQPEDRPAWDALYYPILSVLAAAFGPLSAQQLQIYAAVPSRWIPRALENLAQFMDALPDGRYRLYHSTFPEFLTGRATASPDDPFHINRRTSHGLLGGRLLRANADWLACQDRYALAYTPAHLLEAASGLVDPDGHNEVIRSLSTLLTDFGFLEQKTAVLGIDELLLDLHAANEVIPATESTVPILRRILDRDAHKLRDWDREHFAGLLAQQIHYRAISGSHTYLSEEAVRRLASRGRPYLVVQWQVGERSVSPVRTLTGHVSAVLTLAITPDGSRAVSGSRGGTLIVWDLRSGQQLRSIAGHRAKIRAVAITADGRRALSTSEDWSFKLWNLETGQVIKTLSDDQYFAIAIAPNGQRAICCAGSGELDVWDLDSGQRVKTLPGHELGASAVAMTADEHQAVSGSIDGTLKVWDVESGQLVRTLTGHTQGVMAVALPADGRRALSASEDHTVKVWDLENGELVRTLTGHEREVMDVAVTADGRRALSGSWDGKVKVWDVESGREVHSFTGHDDEVWAVALTADGRRGVSGSADQTLHVWDLDSQEDPTSISGDGQAVSAASVTRDGSIALLGSHDGSIKLRDVDSGTELRTLVGHEPMVWAVTTQGHFALSGSADNSLRLWDVNAGREIKTFTGHNGTIYSVAITADGRRAVSCSADRTVRLWNLQKATFRSLIGHEEAVLSVAISPDGRRAISGSTDGTVGLWNLEKWTSRTLVGHEEAVPSVAISPDGRRAISGSIDGTLEVWDLDGLLHVSSLRGHKYPVFAVAVSLDGRRAISCSVDGALTVWDFEAEAKVRRLAGRKTTRWTTAVASDGRLALTGSIDGTLKLVDLKTRKKTPTLTGHKGHVRTVAMTADGERAITASLDGTVKVWDLHSGHEAGTLIRTVPRREPKVSAVGVSPDGRRAISGTEGGTLRLWDLQTGQELGAFPECAPEASLVAVGSNSRRAISAGHSRSLTIWDLETGAARTLADDDNWAWAATPDNRWAVSGGTLIESVVKLWNLDSGKARKLGSHFWPTAVAIAPDRETALSGSMDGTLKVWYLRGRKKVSTIAAHNGEIRGLAITSDGSRAVSASGDRTVRVWDVMRREAVCMMAFDAAITSLTASADAATILVGDALQNLWCLRLH